MKVTKDTVIGDILDAAGEAAAPIFFSMGMHCLGCPASGRGLDNRLDALFGDAPAPYGSDSTLCSQPPVIEFSALVTSRR